jgi:two-component system, LytTR family, response regulator
MYRLENLKVVIADDDSPSRMILFHFTEMFPGVKMVGEAENGEDLIKTVMEKRPDIILVDINMPGINGVEAVKMCREINPTIQVIFTTGYDEYAVEAYSMSVVDYLVKPIERTRLFVALDKAKQAIERRLDRNKNKAPRKLVVKSQNFHIFLLMEDILFIEKEGRKSVIHTKNERYETTESLQEIEERLPDYFFKTHRSYIVNLKKVYRIESSGETFLAYFHDCDKISYISKLKINEVQDILNA